MISKGKKLVSILLHGIIYFAVVTGLVQLSNIDLNGSLVNNIREYMGIIFMTGLVDYFMKK